jgi:O-acetyl-ADP-ribose deacetylase (regulator of RNase III)/SOS response regulatory protein OraA/RecX
MGKGVAQEFKRRYPGMFADYVNRFRQGQLRLGEPYPYYDRSEKLIINFPTMDHWRSPSRLVDIERGLDYFVQHHKAWNVKSIAFPPLGCGNGGLEWTEVGPLIYRKLKDLDIDIEVYAPYGTPKHELTIEFLGQPYQLELDGKGRKAEKLNPEWIVLMEVLRGLKKQPYACPVGRAIFQKICYVVTDLGVETGFQFDKGSYGPFAHEVKQTLHEFANRNWLNEERLGQMIALRVSDEYERARTKYSESIKRNESNIAKAVDLFSRIKNTQQAEEVLTVLFASRQLKRARPDTELAEQQLFDFILNWKKTWRTEEKERALASAIRNLVMLGWMKLAFSDTLPEVV